MTLEALEHLARADKILGRLIKRVGPCTLKPQSRRTPFQSLVRSVAYQQLNGTAAATILGRVKALYPTRRFPTPEDLLATPDERLRGAGLSRAKTAAIKDIAAKTIAGVVPGSRVMAGMSEAEIVERLTTLRGVGPWTVEMLLIFTLGRTDVLPVTVVFLARTGVAHQDVMGHSSPRFRISRGVSLFGGVGKAPVLSPFEVSLPPV